MMAVPRSRGLQAARGTGAPSLCGGGGAASRTRRARSAAKKLDAAIMKELPPLKLEKARFRTALSPLAEGGMGRRKGASASISRSRPLPARRPDRLHASPPAASWRASCSRSKWCSPKPPPRRRWSSTRSIAASAAPRQRRSAKGCTCSAKERQVLVVTHSPQVAARGGHHWRVAQKRRPRAARSPASTSSIPASGARRSPACSPAAPSPPRRAPPRRASWSGARGVSPAKAARTRQSPSSVAESLTDRGGQDRAADARARDRASRPALS